MKMLSDLLIGHNWPFFVKLTKKLNWLTQMSCIALMGTKRSVLIPTYQEHFFKLNRTFASQVIVVLICQHTENRRKIIIQSILDLCGHV